MVLVLSTLTALVAGAATAVAASSCATVQYSFPSSAQGDSNRAAAVADEYRYVWNQYKKQAFGLDELDPISMKGENDLFGWGATIVDGIDTAIIMGLTDIVKDQLAFIAKFDFSRSNYTVNHFDAVIRYIGGLISAYDLINSDQVPKGTYDKAQVDALLKAARTISDGLKPTFKTPSGAPLDYVNFTTGQASNCNPVTAACSNTVVNTARTGTIILDWYRLSDLTGDSSYRDLAAKAESVLISPSQKLRYPYLVGSGLDYNTGKFISQDVGWQGGIDSFYEYLIKTYIYDPTRSDTATYRDFWVNAVKSTQQNLALHPFEHPELTFISQADSAGNLTWTMDDYACFAGGNFFLGGAYLLSKSISSLGYAVTDSCHALFNTSTAGLNPIAWSWFNSKNQTYDTTAEKDPYRAGYAHRNGYFVDDPFWGALPEPIESMWYAYRITGDSKWADYGWSAFQAMLNDTKNRQSGVTFAELTNVTQPRGGALIDNVPAFLFAEVLKYFYLFFTPPSTISLDKWVFNTEGHPFKIKSGTCALG